ncbi:hypothetical protein [Sphingomonas fennica]|jgi:hypothetical protein|uniref:Uncharacterized protein n=1 Tax=Edaphosphingomonas fennica TaxID=114404 RepID=A0A2T4HSC1_9SPHN|nr:hypothetical protein [Sphingomonas fennica]PTD18657.1 hypothetical protein CV103_14675 [Sphingomonas fennica]
MHATVLVILCEGHKSLTVCGDEAQAWSELIAFVDSQWTARFGPALPPHDEAQRVRSFFRADEHYLLASTDLSKMAERMNEGAPAKDWFETLRLR